MFSRFRLEVLDTRIKRSFMRSSLFQQVEEDTTNSGFGLTGVILSMFGFHL